MLQATRKSRSIASGLIAFMACLIATVLFTASVYCTPAYAATATKSQNFEMHNYSPWAQPTYSYLEKTPSGYQRVEYANGKSLVVEDYSNDFVLKTTKTINASTYRPSDLPSNGDVLWGGYLATSNANYVVTGQTNWDESDTLKVVRVTKYSKSWSYLSHCEISGINTVCPFDAGSLSMVEQGGKLWIRTCHEMYKSLDGRNHQASMLFTIDPSSMKLIGEHVGIASIAHSGWGYVSHSFNQLLTVANGKVYTLDHGDAYPRAFVVKQLADSEEELTPYAEILAFPGETGDNFTGAMVGGFGYSNTSNNFISVGSSVNLAKLDTSKTFNAFALITKSDLSSTKKIDLTSYKEGVGGAANPFLVKISDNKFLVIWQVLEIKGQMHAVSSTLSFQYIDGNGAKLSKVYSTSGYLSDCQPIVVGKKVIWYATGKYIVDKWGDLIAQDTEPTFYALDTSSNTVAAHSNQVSLAKASITVGAKTYTGKALSPSITVKVNGKKLTKNVDYSVKYSNNKNVGKATVTITGKGNYKDTAKATFKINPKSTSISKLTGSKKAITVKWKKKTTQTTGYQIRYSTSKTKDKNGQLKKGKTVTVSKNKTTTKTIKKMKGGKKYYVQIRTYKTVKGTKYYSTWSKPKAVKTKK